MTTHARSAVPATPQARPRGPHASTALELGRSHLMGQWVRVVVLAAAHNSRLHWPFDHLPDPVLAGWAAGDSADHDPAASRQCPWQPQPGDRPLRMKGRRWEGGGKGSRWEVSTWGWRYGFPASGLCLHRSANHSANQKVLSFPARKPQLGRRGRGARGPGPGFPATRTPLSSRAEQGWRGEVWLGWVVHPAAYFLNHFFEV